jgi:hypothetical protein
MVLRHKTTEVTAVVEITTTCLNNNHVAVALCVADEGKLGLIFKAAEFFFS